MNTTKFAAHVLSLLSLLIVVNVIAVSGEGSQIPTPTNEKPLCGCQYGDYIMLDQRWSHEFWTVRGDLGYTKYYQRGFDSFGEMLNWSSRHSVDFGWKEGSKYGQLFYHSFTTGTKGASSNVNFDSETTMLLPLSSCWDFSSNDFDSRMAFVKTSVLESHPSFKGTSALSEWNKCQLVSSGVQGDPHFKTWNGELYDFHGVCDLVLLKNSEFENGLGMYMHIRTKRMRMWSYVSNAAIQIGKDSFEVMGGGEHKFWRNGVLGRKERLQNEGNEMIQISTLSGYPVYVDQVSDKSIQFVINLHREEKIEIGTWNSFVRINFDNTNSNHFEGSEGLMGSFPSGVKLARDKFTVMEDLDIFGQEWQVSQSEPKLFHNIEGPQYPTQCGIPSSSEMRRRLSKTSLSVETAKRACNDVHTDIIEMCVFDVLATSSVLTAGAY